MKFMLMMHAPANCAEALAQWSQADFKAHIEFMIALNKELTASGELLLAEGLAMPNEAKIVKAKQPGNGTRRKAERADDREWEDIGGGA